MTGRGQHARTCGSDCQGSPNMQLPHLTALLRCHSTPGDEEEVAVLLLREWQRAGLETVRHGRYAVSTCSDSRDPGLPTVLVCAHMDSPGYTVERLEGDRARLVELGKPRFDEDEAPAVLKTRDRKVRVAIVKNVRDDGGMADYCIPALEGVAPGDRVCFDASPSVAENGLITSAFLDNRLGCSVLSELAHGICRETVPVNLVLGATSCEEMGGFGAPVLANAVQPDMVICLDATYEAPDQNVLMGHGPVLTLSDASVILDIALRERVARLFAEHGLPLQTEVYNYSGTDARAFPHQGLSATVLPLLIATQGNHSPEERASLRDMETWIRAVEMIVREAAAAGLTSRDTA